MDYNEEQAQSHIKEQDKQSEETDGSLKTHYPATCKVCGDGFMALYGTNIEGWDYCNVHWEAAFDNAHKS